MITVLLFGVFISIAIFILLRDERKYWAAYDEYLKKKEMNISDLIGALERIREEEGDLPVYFVIDSIDVESPVTEKFIHVTGGDRNPRRVVIEDEKLEG